MKHYFIDIFLLLTYSHCLPAVLVMLNNPRFCINIHSVHIYHLYWILDTSCGHFPTSILWYVCLCWLPKWFFIRVEFRGWCFRRCAGGGGAAAAFSVVPETASNCSISDYIRRMQARNIITSAWKSSIRRFVITEKAPTRAFSWLKAPTSAFTFKTLLRHYAKRVLTPR